MLVRLGKIIVGIVASLLLALVIFDPPPLRLRDADEFVLSVTAPNKLDPQFTHPIEGGLACNRKLQSWTSHFMGRPVITIFDWLRREFW